MGRFWLVTGEVNVNNIFEETGVFKSMFFY